MSRTVFLALAIGLISLTVAVPAHAVLITVNFTVTGAANDPVNAGVTANGSFSFDSSIVPPGGGDVVNPAASGFSLTWDGTSWTDANTTIYLLTFNASGDLTDLSLFGDPSAGLMLASPSVDDFILFGVSSPSFHYTRLGDDGVNYIGTIEYSVTTGSAPVPASWILLGAGLLGVMGTVRRPSRG